MGIFKLAKTRDKKMRDLELVKCIKDEHDHVLVKGEDVKRCGIHISTCLWGEVQRYRSR